MTTEQVLHYSLPAPKPEGRNVSRKDCSLLLLFAESLLTADDCLRLEAVLDMR